MNLITLTSDLGIKDFYVASVKAMAYRLVPDLAWVDITHQISPFDMAKAAFVLKNVWREFPPGAIHIVAVDSEWSLKSPYVVVKKENHYFIGCDNGFFSLLFDGEPADEVYVLATNGDEDLVFPTRSIFLPAAAKIASGELQHFVTKKEQYRSRPGINPVITPGSLRGTAIYIDTYGNVITNITKELFEKQVGQQPFQIVVRRGDSDLNKISRTYNEVPEGEKVALFTTAGYLEIAINRGVEGSGGGASDLLGIRESDIIRIEIG